jgi:transposase
MESTELYQQILGITAPWFVESVEIDHQQTSITVVLAHATVPGVFRCPKCDGVAPVYDYHKMWPPFATAARTQLPDADLVYDRFHLSEHLNAAVDQTRRQEHKRLSCDLVSSRAT